MSILTFVRRPSFRPLIASLAAAVACGQVVIAYPDVTRLAWREAATDRLLLQSAPERPGSVIVVDIDSASIEAVGPWPWPRARIAEMIGRLAIRGASVVAVDIADPQAQPDDPALVRSEGMVPVVLGALLSDATTRSASAIPPAPLAIRGHARPLMPWRSRSALGPTPMLAAAAAGVGVSSMAPDPDGLLRRVPVLAVAGRTVLAGLAAEAVRHFARAGAFILDGSSRDLRIGPHTLPLTHEADLRIRPTDPTTWPGRTIAARDVLDAGHPLPSMAGKIVLIGGSAPDLGALRPTFASPVTPAVQIQADAVETILGGRVPVRPSQAGYVEVALALLLGSAAAVAGTRLSPGWTIAASAGLALGHGAIASAVVVMADRIVDPVTPALFPIIAGTTAALVTAQASRRTATAVRRRFEQYLAPSVVARIVARPDLLSLAGERREITAMSTDIEGFTALIERIGADELVRLLDRYFEIVIGIVIAHGGMVDKIVGDGVHALFNAPLDLADHPGRAIDAARAIIAATERLRTDPDQASARLGRTRIGIETGVAIVGDVGSAGKLDYTAYGLAVNTAARLEALNKAFGSSICVGPECRSRCPERRFRALGRTEVRGIGALDLYEPLG